MAVEKKVIGALKDGRELECYTLRNQKGTEASFTNLGAIWMTMFVPDRNGVLGDVVLGYDTPENLMVDPGHCGAPVGRNANRIGEAKFTLNGVEYKLASNDNGSNNLHSGPDFYRQRFWDANTGESEDGSFVEFSLHSPHMDQGYPGNADIKVRYTLTEDSSLSIEYTMTSDQDTIANFTNHAYFNLNGYDSGTIMDQIVWINAENFTPSDAKSIPTGEIASVEGTPMDFREGKRIGEEIDADFDQLNMAGGYDHNWLLNDYDGDVRLVARAMDPKSGRIMEVYTDLDGMQFYTANFMDSPCEGKNHVHFGKRCAFCFETQHVPDSANKPMFVSPFIKAGETYHSTTIYRFDVEA